MAITRAVTGTVGINTVAATTLNVPYPSPIKGGQVLVLFISSNAAVTAPAGWTTIYNEATVVNPKGGLWIKVATGAETGNLAVTTASAISNGVIVSYDGVDEITPQDATATNVSLDATTDVTIDLPAITTVTDGAVPIACGTANSSTVTHTGPGTELVDFGVGGTGKAGALYELSPVSPFGSTGVQTITQSAGRAYWGAMLVLRPSKAPLQMSGSPWTTTFTGSGAKTAGGNFSAGVGDLIVVRATDEDAVAGDMGTSTPSNTGSAVITWTARGVINTGSFAEVGIWTGIVTGAGTVTVSLNVTGNNWGFMVSAFAAASHGGVGLAPAAATGTGTAPTLSAAWAANSFVLPINADWSAVVHGPPRAYRTGLSAAVEDAYAQVDGNYTTETWDHHDTGAGGSVAVGLTTPTQTWSLVAVEVLAPVGGGAAAIIAQPYTSAMGAMRPSGMYL